MNMKLTLTILFVAATALHGQTPAVIHLTPAKLLTAKAGSTLKAGIPIEVDEGYHVNSNTPADQFLIPLRLTWNPGPLESAGVAFPRPQLEKHSFSQKPVSVFTGSFEIVARFRVPASAAPGPVIVAGKLHYQACNDTTCLTPKTIDVTLPVEVVK